MPSGRWCKKVKGRFHYFGKVADDPKGEAAIALWTEQKDDLLAGRTPRPKADGFTVRELCDRFMVSRRRKMDAGELTAASFADCFATCRRIIDFFGAARLVADRIGCEGVFSCAHRRGRCAHRPSGCATCPRIDDEASAGVPLRSRVSPLSKSA